MKKKPNLFFVLAITLIAAFQLNSYSQGEKLERPDNSGVAEVDRFVNKSFDSYDESLKITEGVKFIHVDPETKKITNSQGEILTPEYAAMRLGELLVRAKKQTENLGALNELHKSATESVKTCPVTKKPKATKNLTRGAEALKEVASQTKTQLEEIERQIGELKALNK